MKAVLIQDDKFEISEFLVQIRVWQLPVSTPERPHGPQYSRFFGRSGERIVCYDNESGKGDHRHYRDREEPYVFTDLVRLVRDFKTDIGKEIGNG